MSFLVKNMHFKIFKIIATRGFLTPVECTKSIPAGGAHDAPPDPLVGWGGGHPLPISHPLDAFGVSVSSPAATRPRRLRRLVPKTPSEIFFWIRPWHYQQNWQKYAAFSHGNLVVELETLSRIVLTIQNRGNTVNVNIVDNDTTFV